MIDTVLNYIMYLDDLSNLIKKSYHKPDYFIQHLGISQSTYYRKLRKKSFTTKEVKTITLLLFSDEKIMKALQQSEADLKAGRTFTYKEARQILRSNHFIDLDYNLTENF